MTQRIETRNNVIGQDSQLAATGILQQRSRFDQNYGAMTMVMGYLPRIEQLKMQGLDIWWYNVGVSRVQVHFEQPEMIYFADYKPNVLAISEKAERFDCKGEKNFSNAGWFSCQVGRSRLFQADERKQIIFRVLKIHPFQKSFTVEESMAKPDIEHVQCLTNFKNQFIFVFDIHVLPRRYSLAENRWEELPPLENWPISACSLEDKVYVFCEHNGKNYISVLYNAGASISSQELHWQVIQVPSAIATPRYRGVGFVPLNSTQIAILGGYGDSRLLGDIFTLNTSTWEFTKELEDRTDPFTCQRNQTAKVCEDTIIAQVTVTNGQTRLIKYTKGDTCLTIIQM